LDQAELLHKQIKEQQTALADSVARGSAKDFESYRETVGEIKGLQRVLRMIEDMPRD
jgi:hypothetical protein